MITLLYYNLKLNNNLHISSQPPASTMNISQLLPLTLYALPGALASFRHSNMDCDWWGTAPFCSSSGSSVGDKDDDNRELVITTEDLTRAAACYQIGFQSNFNNACLDAYGQGCITGYKRLWCK